MSHFVIESLLKYTSSKVMSSEKFLREAMLGARTFEYTIDDFDTNFYKSVGLYSIDVKLYLNVYNEWVVKSLGCYCDLIFLARHDYNYDIDIKFYYHIISCEINQITQYEENTINNMLYNIYTMGDASVDINCNIVKYGNISRAVIRARDNIDLIDYLNEHIQKYEKLNVKVENELLLDFTIQYSDKTNKLLDLLILIYEKGNNLMCDDCLLNIDISIILSSNSKNIFNEKLYEILNKMNSKLMLLKLRNIGSVIHIHLVNNYYTELSCENRLGFNLLKNNFNNVYVNGDRI